MLCFILDFIQCLKKTKKKKTTKTISEQSKIDILRKDTNNRTLEREEHQTSKRVEHFC